MLADLCKFKKSAQSLTIVSPLVEGGVNDFTKKLAENLGPSVKQFRLSEKSCVDFESIIQTDCLYLQYSGYGYAKRGVPFWLLRELQRNRHNIAKFGVFFHELYATGSPWKSAFWLSSFQREVALELAAMSDFWMTNREGSAEWLRQYAGDKPHAVLPVFSNVGEMLDYSSMRVPKVVIFGGPDLRQAVYRVAGETLLAWAKQQKLQIHDIGPAFKDTKLLKHLEQEGVMLHGRLSPEEISNILSDALFGVVAYPVEYVAKSGVFAAYCAHGVGPILITPNTLPMDGLEAYKHYLPGIPGQFSLSESPHALGHSAWLWYQRHNIDSHLNSFNKLAQ